MIPPVITYSLIAASNRGPQDKIGDVTLFQFWVVDWFKQQEKTQNPAISNLQKKRPVSVKK